MVCRLEYRRSVFAASARARSETRAYPHRMPVLGAAGNGRADLAGTYQSVHAESWSGVEVYSVAFAIHVYDDSAIIERTLDAFLRMLKALFDQPTGRFDRSISRRDFRRSSCPSLCRRRSYADRYSRSQDRGGCLPVQIDSDG
jgi:hypothetical protein